MVPGSDFMSPENLGFEQKICPLSTVTSPRIFTVFSLKNRKLALIRE